jgi:hypothetical protein
LYFANFNFFQDDNFFTVCDDQGEVIEKMKKTRFLWILHDEKHRLSSDRLIRFREGKKEMTVPRVISKEPFYVDTALTHGDFVIFNHSLRSYLAIVGQIINFSYDAKTKKARKYSYSYCIINVNKKVKITLSPCYSVQNTGKLIPYDKVVFEIDQYKSSVKSNVINFNNLCIDPYNVEKLENILK